MILELRDIACGYAKEGRAVLEDVNVEFDSKKVYCLLGPNGCGKTTLFKTLLGLMDPLQGRVLLDGENLAGIPAGRRAQCLSYVPQAYRPPFAITVLEAVLLGCLNRLGYTRKPAPKDYDLALQTLDAIGIADFAERTVDGLSGGELQLVSIARAVVSQPGIIVLDEPTAALDYGNMLRVLKHLQQLSEQGFGVIMSTHNPDQAFLLDAQVVLLRRGSVVANGPAWDVINERNMRAAYGIDVKTVEFADAKERVRRVCAPEF